MPDEAPVTSAILPFMWPFESRRRRCGAQLRNVAGPLGFGRLGCVVLRRSNVPGNGSLSWGGSFRRRRMPRSGNLFTEPDGARRVEHGFGLSPGGGGQQGKRRRGREVMDSHGGSFEWVGWGESGLL